MSYWKSGNLIRSEHKLFRTMRGGARDRTGFLFMKGRSIDSLINGKSAITSLAAQKINGWRTAIAGGSLLSERSLS